MATNNTIEVLIVDDSNNVRSTLRHTLSGLNCAFSEAETGEEALSRIQKNSFDVIFMDLRLPGIDGLETFRRAKRIHPNLGRVIIVTGYPESDTLVEAQELGAFAYLTKAKLDRDEIRDTVLRASTIASDVGHAIQTRGSKDAAVLDVPQSGQPFPFRSTQEASSPIEKRYAFLVDKKFESFLSPSEEAELIRLEHDLDEVDSVFYQPIKDGLIAERTRLEEKKQDKKE